MARRTGRESKQLAGSKFVFNPAETPSNYSLPSKFFVPEFQTNVDSRANDSYLQVQDQLELGSNPEQRQKSADELRTEFEQKYCGISKDEIMQKSAAYVFTKIQQNMERSKNQLQDLRIKQLKKKLQTVNDFQKIQTNFNLAKQQYLMDKTEANMKKYHEAQILMWHHGGNHHMPDFSAYGETNSSKAVHHIPKFQKGLTNSVSDNQNILNNTQIKWSKSRMLNYDSIKRIMDNSKDTLSLGTKMSSFNNLNQTLAISSNNKTVTLNLRSREVYRAKSNQHLSHHQGKGSDNFSSN